MNATAIHPAESFQPTAAPLSAGLRSYYPEMGDRRPPAKIEAKLSRSGRHYFIYSVIELSGRGIEFLETVKPGDMINDRRDGWHHYKVTCKAFEAICAQHAVAYETLLD